nr:MAG TPA: hypothetical protein [Caudoviricetes sp.]
MISHGYKIFIIYAEILYKYGGGVYGYMKLGVIITPSFIFIHDILIL